MKWSAIVKNICIIWNVISQIHCISLVSLSGIIRFYMLDYIVCLGLKVLISQEEYSKYNSLISFSTLFRSYADFLISFKVGFTFRRETCLIWFWHIISSAYNSCGIICHSSFKIIFLWWVTFGYSFIRFSIILFIFRSLLFCWFFHFVFYCQKSINIYSNKRIIRIFTNI